MSLASGIWNYLGMPHARWQAALSLQCNSLSASICGIEVGCPLHSLWSEDGGFVV
jgi:hypothetical protein